MGLFDKQPTPKELAKQQQRDLKGTTRELERDQRAIEAEERKLEAEIKAVAKRGDEASARILAKQLVKLREQKTKTMMMKSNVSATSYQAQSIASQSTMMNAMGSTTKSMATMNQQMNVKQMQAMMGAYERESAKMEMGQEMMDETFDGIFEGNEAEESEVMDKLYDEIGIEFSGKVGNAPTRMAQQESTLSDTEVESRMAALLRQ